MSSPSTYRTTAGNAAQAIAEFAVNTARLAGFIPSNRQPGAHKLWEGYLILFTENYRGDYANIELTVYH